MQNEPIRILQILGIVAGGGVESVVMNYYEHIDRAKVQFDFVVHNDNIIDITDKVKSMGGKVYKVTPYYKNPIAFMRDIYQIIKHNNYQIIHSNMNTLSALSLFAAYMADVPVRILHNHSISVPGEWKRNLLKYILRPFAKLFANQYWACGKLAGIWMYGENLVNTGKVQIINNAIDLAKFEFNENKRLFFRQQFNINHNDFIIGHVGRFVYVKNHEFLIDVFDKFHKVHNNSKLLLIGDGPLKKDIERKVISLGLSDSVIFGGMRNNVSDLYSVMDVLLLPSFSEGFGVVGLEAQANSLPIIVSDVVTKELFITNLISSEELSSPVETWLMDLETIYYKKDEPRDNTWQTMDDAGFDIQNESVKLVNMYKHLLEEYRDGYK